MFRKLSLRFKLTLAFLLTASLVAGVSIYQIKSVDQFNNESIQRVGSNSDRLSRLEAIRLKVINVERQASDFYRDYLSGNPVDVKSQKAELQKLGQGIKLDEEAYLKLSMGSAAFNQASTILIFEHNSKLVQAAVGLVESVDAGEASKAAGQAADLVGKQKAIDDEITQEAVSVSKLIDAEEIVVAAEAAGITRTNIVLAVLSVSVAVIFGLLVAEALSRSIGRIQQGAERIANGDFSRTLPVKSGDEVGRLAEAFNKMALRLKDSYSRLAFERQRDETLLESINDGLIAIDSYGKIVLVNSMAVEILELDDRTTLSGRQIDDVLKVSSQDDKPLPSDYHPAHEAYETAQSVNESFTYHKKDGRKIAIQVGMSPVVLDGKAAGVIMVVRDVTREREVDRMKTEFISLASHQLRTPLSAIKWFSEMLLSGDAGKLTADQAEFAKNVADSTERMIDLVNSLLNISRIESGRIMIDPKPTDLSELVNGIVNDLKAKTEERKQTLVVSVHKELPKINLDARLIGQVYLNLLTNAVKYTPKGGEVSVFVSRKGDDLVSQISDNGYGIPKAEQGKMFQKFFRATNVSKVETDGTGLGLYLIKAVIESSGGKIWFESEEGKGTTFWFSLPMSGMKPKEGEVTLDS